MASQVILLKSPAGFAIRQFLPLLFEMREHLCVPIAMTTDLGHTGS
jgi:hypothetical protein